MRVADCLPAPVARNPDTAAQVRRDLTKSVGQPLDAALRLRMEARVKSPPANLGLDYGSLEAAADRAAGDAEPHRGDRRPADFSTVRLHADGHAAAATRRLEARAITIGEHVYADPALLPAGVAERDSLIAHELAHVIQQRHLSRILIQPRLLATGDEDQIARFRKLAQPALGKELKHNSATGQITPGKALAQPPTSPRFASMMTKIMTSVQDAEVHFGPGQSGVTVGAFPKSGEFRDMTTNTQQRVDMNHVEKIESGTPGNGLAALAHEIFENFTAHGKTPKAGVDQFEAAHKSGLEVESDVAEDLVGPGRRVADTFVEQSGTVVFVYDFQLYYLLVAYGNPTGDILAVKGSTRVKRAPVLTATIDSYAAGSTLLPASGGKVVDDVKQSLGLRRYATAKVEGFTDTKEAGTDAVKLARSRADGVAEELAAKGVRAQRLYSIGKGSKEPATTNSTEAGRAANRRVTVTIEEPAVGQKK